MEGSLTRRKWYGAVAACFVSLLQHFDVVANGEQEVEQVEFSFDNVASFIRR